jgi:nitrogen regulatory protein PII
VYLKAKLKIKKEKVSMKAVLIVHNAALDEEVNEALQSIGINCYTKFTNTRGKGEISEPHLDTDVWPGINYGTFVVTDHARAKEIMDNVRRMREKMSSEGLKAFMWEIDDIT